MPMFKFAYVFTDLAVFLLKFSIIYIMHNFYMDILCNILPFIFLHCAFIDQNDDIPVFVNYISMCLCTHSFLRTILYIFLSKKPFFIILQLVIFLDSARCNEIFSFFLASYLPPEKSCDFVFPFIHLVSTWTLWYNIRNRQYFYPYNVEGDLFEKC